MGEIEYRNGYDASIGGKALLIGDKLWMMSIRNDVLMCFDWKKKRNIKCYSLPSNDIVEYAHVSIVAANNKIYIFPLYGKGLYVFDVDNERLAEIGNEDNIIGNDIGVCISEEINGDIIFFERKSNSVYKIDGKTEKISSIGENLYSLLEENGFDVGIPQFNWMYCRVNDDIYVPINNSNHFVCFDMNTYQVNIYSLDNKKEISSLCSWDNHVVFTTKGNGRIIWKEGKIIDIKKEGYIADSKYGFLHPISVKDRIYYIPWNERTLFVESDNSVNKIEIPYSVKNNIFPEGEYSQYEAIFTDGENLFLQSRNNGEIYCVDSVDSKVKVIQLVFPKSQLEEILQGLFEKGCNNIKETTTFGLCEYLGSVVHVYN